MESEYALELSPQNFIRINIIYNKDFIPSWYKEGQIDRYTPKADNPPWLYAMFRSEEWNKVISPLISPVFKRALGIPFNPMGELTCYVLEHRVKVAEDLFIEAHSNPLAIWAKPKDPQWNYLPFHARVIHELGHIIGPGYSPLWEVFEEEVKNMGENERDLLNNRPLLEELVVRNKTYQITKEAFGQEFADWFLGQESKTVSD